MSKLTLVGTSALVVAACGSSSPGTSSGGTLTNPGVPAGITVSAFTTDIGATMSLLKPLTAYATKGANSLLIGVILPDTTSSTRWVNFDQPYLTAALADAGFNQNQFRIDNAQGSDATELALATADINLGAKVLIMCPLDGPTGVAIAQSAESKGVTLVSYDRATFQGSKTYYVSFNNEAVGEAIGNGFLSCVSSWGVKSPQVFVLNGGEDTDPNAISFATGYNKVVWSQAAKTVAAGATNSQGMTLVGENFAPGWSNTQGGTIFQQEFTSHPSINATIEANDGLGNAVINVLKAAGVPPKKIPVTGQDATAQGMAWVLEGYQCGSVYKPVYKEAQDAVAMATILLSGNSVPAALLNGTTVNPANSSVSEPASLLTATWVDATNMEATVVKDGFDPASAICAIAGASLCTSAGIS
ncbi:MAG TPA: substrate-binding domain-containing protein [Candidatus Saccharimonadales bacterium]|nr:substrate-binding domain-containing protein [Candidatus Saccharimonadales bacterium]